LTEHLRVWVDGRLRGYELLIEQPNKSFLARNQRDGTGALYKADWRGHGIVGQHETKTRLTEGHGDLVALIQKLDQRSGEAQWEFIRQNFNVEEFVNYYAVNMCIQNWDGFFNNYFTYHDTGGTGKWEIYPWDEDKTWGDYDGASPNYDWYEMPLTFGMTGDQPPRWKPFNGLSFGSGPHGGPNWWRHPGWFSGPILANAEFRQRFLARLQELCLTTFTEEKLMPIIDDMERRLTPEIPVRARALGQDAGQAMKTFQRHVQSFRNQVRNRRQFILNQLISHSVLMYLNMCSILNSH
jgi:spore coat protein CotH